MGEENNIYVMTIAIFGSSSCVDSQINVPAFNVNVGDTSPATYTFSTNNVVCYDTTTFSLKESYSWISLAIDAAANTATITVASTSNADAGSHTVTL